MHHDTTQDLYRVTVGHFQITVKAATAEDAIQIARRQLSLDMPLFYDIIRALEATRFAVQHAA